MDASIRRIEALLSADAFAAVRLAPAFRAAAERIAAGALEQDAHLDEATRWLTKDLGRVSLYLSTLILHASLGRVSVHDLAEAAAYNETCSRGRVLAFVDYAQAAGRLSIPSGEEHWTRRPLTLHPSFLDYARERFWLELEGAALVAPEAALALEHRGDERALPAVLANSGLITVVRRDLFFRTERPLSPFLGRDVGMRVLHDWLTRQDPGRQQLLESVALNRAELSRRYHVSRAHLNQLFADAQAAGLLTTPSPDRVCFTPLLSDDLEQHFALTIQLSRLNAIAVLEACRAELREPAPDRRAL